MNYLKQKEVQVDLDQLENNKNMSDFVTRDIEYLHDELSKVKIMLPRQGYNREEMSLYDILAYMTRFTKDVYLIKLNGGRYRAVYDIHSEIFEGDSEVDALYKMVMSFIENKESYYITPPKKPNYILSCDWEVYWGKPNIPKVRYADISNN